MLLRQSLVAGIVLSGMAAAQSSIPDGARVDPDLQPHGNLKGPGHGSIGLQLGFYDHGDNGDGNPFLDESLTVIEPVVVFDYSVTDRLDWGGIISFDYISSASIDRLSKFNDQSGASGDTYLGGDFHASYVMSDRWTIGGHAGFSTEYDYSSLGVGVNATHSPRNADATLSYSLDAYLDDVDIIRYDGDESEGSESRTSLSGSINWYQVLTPTTHGSFGVTVAQQSGFLETPYNAVVIEDPMDAPNPNLANMARGTETNEELPDDRFRLALFGKVRKSIGDGRAWELGGRFYDDDWGIQSITVEPRYYVSLSDRFDLRLRYRYYTQSESDYFADHFTTTEEFRTQDSDLGDYDAQTLGAKVTWYKNDRSTFDLSLDFTARSDGLDYIYAAFGWTWGF